MTRREFDQGFGPMVKQLGVKVNRFQADLYFDEFQNKDQRDFQGACRELGFGRAGYLPGISYFRDGITAFKDERIQKEKDNQHKQPMGGRINFTEEERLIANRAAYECARQAREGKRTGKNYFDAEKVRVASHDPSKDDEIRAKYGNETPNPAEIFGNVGRPVELPFT